MIEEHKWDGQDMELRGDRAESFVGGVGKDHSSLSSSNQLSVCVGSLLHVAQLLLGPSVLLAERSATA